MQSPPADRRLQNLEQENKQLRIALDELVVLNDIASAIASTMSLEQIIDLIVSKCVKHLNVEQGSVSLLQDKEEDTPFVTYLRKDAGGKDRTPFRFDSALSGWMLHHVQPLLTNDLRRDDRFSGTIDDDFPIRALLSVPLLLKGRMIGHLSVFNKQTEDGFTEDDQRLLSIISGQSSQVIENARLYEEEQELNRVHEELRMAYQIQAHLLPESPPDIPGYDIAGISLPARNVGGDYFDFIAIDEQRWGVCVCDATGKGLPAALLMSNAQATIRSQALLSASPKTCMEQANRLLYRSTDASKFVTAFYGVLDTINHTVAYANAGHNDPVHWSGEADPKLLHDGGPILGVIDNMAYEEETVALEPGDLLVLYSDGITEALNEQNEEFGEDRLYSVIRRHPDASSSFMIDHILEEVNRYCGATPQSDDRTVLVVRRDV